MAKIKTQYSCSSCGYSSGKWLGKCPACEEWNSFEENIISSFNNSAREARPAQVKNFAEAINIKSGSNFLATEIEEFDNSLAGGIELGSLILLGGEPGIGKSTLTLQICSAFIKNKKSVLYVSGEEGLNQVAKRAQRINNNLQELKFIQEYNIEIICATAEELKPDLLIIDSIQVMFSENLSGSSGSVNQVRLCTEKIMELCKRTGITVIIIGHVTKDGNLAGPRVLEHLVDVVIQLDGSRTQDLRFVRCMKNRFGPTNEVGILEMNNEGLKSVVNPSEKLLEGRPLSAIGSSLACIMEGKRPLVIEIQALCSKTVFGYPKRSANGCDLNRVNMLIAVLQKYLKLDLISQDVYINVVGGIKINDPASDAAICAAIISSFLKRPLPKNKVYMGEVGLSGEIRKSSFLDRRLNEINKLKLQYNDESSELSILFSLTKS